MPLTHKERQHFRSPFGTKAHAVWQGELLEITYLPKDKQYRRPGKRGQVKGFTRSARLRMLRTIASVQWGAMKCGVFITLTYPDSHAERDMRQRTRDRYLFVRYMENYLGKPVGVLWRVEWKTRKSGKNVGCLVAHLHLIVFGVRFIPKEMVKQWWRLVLSAAGPVVTWIDAIDSGRKVGRYVSKYCSKLPEANVLDNASYLNSLGRHWGIQRKEKVPFAPRFLIPYLDAEEIKLCDNLGAMTFKFFTRGTQQGFSCFGANAEKVGELLLSNMIDKEERRR